MSKKFVTTGLFLLILLMSIGANAQRNELAITAGAQFPYNNQYSTGTSFAVGANYAHRIIHLPLVALYWEIPVVVAPKTVLRVPSSANYSSLFITPGLKLKLAPEFPVSPYFAVGGGYARYKLDSSAAGNDTANTAVFDFGAGVDFKFFPYLSWRFEGRDFYTGSPSFGALGETGRQHNLVAQTGMVFRF